MFAPLFITLVHPSHPSGSSSSYEGLKNAFGILNENLLLNLSDTGVSPAKLAVVCLIAAVLAVDVAVLWLISRNTIAEARTFFKDNFYFRRIRLVYPTPVPRQNTPKHRLKQLFQDIREEHKQKLQQDYDYGSPYGLDYDGTASASSAPEYTGSGGEDNKLFGKLFPTSNSATAPDYDYIEDERDKRENSLFGNIFSSPAKAKPSWSPVSGPSGSGSGTGTGPPSLPYSFYRPSSSTTEPPPPARKAKSIAEQAVDSLSKAGNHLFRKVTSYASSASSSAPAAQPDHDYAASATAFASSAPAPDYGQGHSGSGATSATASAPDYGYFGSVLDGGRSVLDKLSTATR